MNSVISTTLTKYESQEFSVKQLMAERHYISLEIKLYGRPLPFTMGDVLHKIRRLFNEDLYKEAMFTSDIEIEVIETAP